MVATSKKSQRFNLEGDIRLTQIRNRKTVGLYQYDV